MANTISTLINPALYGELPIVRVQSVTVDGSGNITGTGPVVAVAPRPGVAGTVVKVKDFFTGVAKSDTSLDAAGYVPLYDMGDSVAVVFSTDNWVTQIGPFVSVDTILAGANAGSVAAAAKTTADAAAADVAGLEGQMNETFTILETQIEAKPARAAFARVKQNADGTWPTRPNVDVVDWVGESGLATTGAAGGPQELDGWLSVTLAAMYPA